MTILIIFSSYHQHQHRRSIAKQKPEIRSSIKAKIRRKPSSFSKANISRPLIRITKHRQKGLSKKMWYRSRHSSASATSKQVGGMMAREAVFYLQQIKLCLQEVKVSSVAVLTPIIKRWASFYHQRVWIRDFPSNRSTWSRNFPSPQTMGRVKDSPT